MSACSAASRADPHRLFGTSHQRFRPFGPRHEERQVPVPQRGPLGVRDLVPREPADRLQHPEPGVAVGVGRDRHHVLVDQSLQGAEHGRVARDRFGGIGGEAAREHTDGGEHPLLILGQQVEAPGDRGVQGPLPVGRVRGSLGEDGHLLFQPIEQRCGGEQARSRGCEFDRQGQAVEPRTDGRDRRGGVLVHREARIDRASPVGEQLDGCVVGEWSSPGPHARRARGAGPGSWPGPAVRAPPPTALRPASPPPGSAPGCPAPGTCRPRRCSQSGCPRWDRPHRGRPALPRSPPPSLPHRGSAPDPRRGRPAAHRRRELQREPRLAASARAGQGDQPGGAEELREVGEFSFATHERRESRRRRTCFGHPASLTPRVAFRPLPAGRWAIGRGGCSCVPS